MIEQEQDAAREDSLSDGEKATVEGDERQAAHGEADEPDAPAAEEENAAMSTILSADPLLGVQDHSGEG